MEKTLIFIGIHLSLSSAYQKATTIFVVAKINFTALPLILHVLRRHPFCLFYSKAIAKLKEIKGDHSAERDVVENKAKDRHKIECDQRPFRAARVKHRRKKHP